MKISEILFEVNDFSNLIEQITSTLIEKIKQKFHTIISEYPDNLSANELIRSIKNDYPITKTGGHIANFLPKIIQETLEYYTQRYVFETFGEPIQYKYYDTISTINVEDIHIKIVLKSDDNRVDGEIYRDENGIGLVLYFTKTFFREIFFEMIIEEKKSSLSYGKVIGEIVAVYAHELTHLIQALKGQHHTRDISLITAGKERNKNNNKRFGKKGYEYGDVREFNNKEFVWYHSLLGEIDSFSTQAAVQLYNLFVVWGEENKENRKRINNMISSLQRELSKVSSDETVIRKVSTTISSYFDYIYRSMKEEMPEILQKDQQLFKKQLNKVWKKFLKDVYLKLEKFKKPA